MKTLPSQDLLQAIVTYDPETGLFAWRARPVWTFAPKPGWSAEVVARMWNGRWAGKPAFVNRLNTGYLCGLINNVAYQAHRVAWKVTTGNDPEFIDHINGNKADNRIANLRDVSHTANMRNVRQRKDCSSGHPGVTFFKPTGKWQARIGVKRANGDGRISLGHFDTLEEAVAARKAAEKDHGYRGNF